MHSGLAAAVRRIAVIAQEQWHMVVMVWRVFHLEDDLHKREECPVGSVQVVEVFACQELDLIDARLKVLPLRL